MLRKLFLAIFLAGLVGVGFLWPWASVLEITATGTGLGLWCTPVQVGEEFVLSFIHSVNRRPVYDTLRAQSDSIVIVKSRFDAFGAGMPESSTEEGTLALLPDGWLEWTVNRRVPEIILRVGRVANHTLMFRGREIRLADLAEPGSALSFRVRRVSFLNVMKGRCMR
jgi:hypothetical protein